MKTTNDLSNIDAIIGNNLRKIRRKNHLTQEELAREVNLTSQQIQKYETGVNRISCSKIWEFANIFKAPVGVFFEGLENKDAGSVTANDSDVNDIERPYLFNEKKDVTLNDNLDGNIIEDATQNDTIDIVEYINSIQNPRVRESLIAFLKSLIQYK